MKKIWDGLERRITLRTEAESLLTNLSPSETLAQPAEVMLHELLVHKVELEMQNEELRKAHIALEEARDRYVDLYDFAPCAYLTINREGLIIEANLTVATLLGMDRGKLIHRRFSSFVAAQDQDCWHRLFMHIMQTTLDEKQGIDLEVLRADGTSLKVHLDGLRRIAADSAACLRLTLVEIKQ